MFIVLTINREHISMQCGHVHKYTFLGVNESFVDGIERFVNEPVALILMPKVGAPLPLNECLQGSIFLIIMLISLHK